MESNEQLEQISLYQSDFNSNREVAVRKELSLIYDHYLGLL